MYLIVGLGNPEPEYSKTRHNMGFDVINKLSTKYEIEVKKEKIKSAASKRGMSVNEYINCLIDNDLLQNIEWMCYTHMRLIKRGKTHD